MINKWEEFYASKGMGNYRSSGEENVKAPN